MNFDHWQASQRIEDQYRRALQNLIDRFVLMIPGLDILNPYEIVSEFSRYVASDIYGEIAHAIASKMITGLFIESGSTWREAARESTRGKTIYEALRNEMRGPVGHRVLNLVDQNARLISTFPLEIARQANAYIAQEAQKGRRSSDITDDLAQKFPEVSHSRIRLIARTETSKASTELTRARSESMNLPWYAWRTSKDARVRRSHADMDRVLVKWADAPAPEAIAGIRSKLGHYHAGQAPNCRCYAQPVIRLDDIKWPCKVHVSGTIQYMTRYQFE